MDKLIVSPGFVKKIEQEQDTQDQAITANSDAIAKVQNGLAYIVGNTNTAGGTLAVGQFVYVKNHSTIAEGLRTVTASISANGNITTNNTSPVSEGGLNALNSKITEMHSGTITATTSANGNVTIDLPISNAILGAKCTNSVNYIILPFNNYGTWAFNVRSGDAQLSVVANTSVTIYYEYI